jgi:hypothetical protein
MGGEVWTGWMWLRIGTSGRLLWTQWWTFGIHKRQGIFFTSWVTIIFSRGTLLHGVSHVMSENTSLLLKCIYKQLIKYLDWMHFHRSFSGKQHVYVKTYLPFKVGSCIC